MTNKATKYGLMTIAAVLLVAMAFAGAASALDPYTDSTVKLWVNESTDTGIHFHLNESKTLDEVKAIYNSSATGYKITSIDDLVSIGTGSDIYILTQDIYCTTPRSSAVISTFTGTLIGNGYTIYNLTINSSSSNIGLIVALGEHGTLNYVNLTCANISSGSYGVGGLLGRAYYASNITGCNITHSDITGSGSGNQAGGLVGHVGSSSVKIQNCSVENSSISSGSGYVGGLVGVAYSVSIAYSDVKNCIVSTSSSYAGGLIGKANAVSVKVMCCNAKNCMVSAGSDSVGGLVGIANSASFESCNVVNCTVAGTNSGSYYVGGLVGKANSAKLNGCSAKDCVVAGGNNTVMNLVGNGTATEALSPDNVVVDNTSDSTADLQINITRIGMTSSEYHAVNGKLTPAITNSHDFFKELVPEQTYGYAYRSYVNTSPSVNFTELGVYGTMTGFGYLPAYGVIYDGNGATSGSVPVDSGSPYFISSSQVIVLGNIGSLEKAGYTFMGWNLGSPAGEFVKGGESFDRTGTMTLYANWTANETTVLYHNFSAEDYASVVYTYNETAILPIPVISGFVFNGWNLTKASGYQFNGNSTYFTNDNKWNYTGMDGGMLDVYANLTLIQTNVTVTGNTAEFHNENTTVIQSTSGTVTRILLENVSNIENSYANFTAGISIDEIPDIAGTTKEQITVFEINATAESLPARFNVTVTFADEQTATADKDKIHFWHYNTTNNAWDTPYLTIAAMVQTGEKVLYTVETNSFSPFGFGIYTAIPQQYTPSSSSKQTGSTIILQEGQTAPTAYATAAPTVAPTVKPTEKPATPVVIATAKPTTTATTSKSPAPFVGILAGLGAAAVLLRMRK